MVRVITAIVIAAAASIAAGASAQAPFPPPAEVKASWPRFTADSFYTHYRSPEIVRSGSSASVWKMAEPAPSMSKIGVPTLYSRLEFDCAGGRKKILAIARFNADGSVKPPPDKDVELNKWFPVMDAADHVLLKLVCARP